MIMQSAIMRRKIQLTRNHVVIGVVAVIFISPFIFLVSTALKSQTQMLLQPRALFPLPLHFENFLTILESYPVGRYFANTLTVVLFAIIGNVIVSTLAGYALSRIRFKGREFIFVLTLSCMFMPLFLLIIPRFVIFNHLGMIGTLLPLILPSAFGSPFCIFLVRQYLRGVPMDLSEAAYIDGCSEFRIYAQIMLPLMKPIIATVVIFTMQWRWNDFVEPLIYLTSEKLYTITMGIYQILGTGAEEVSTHLVMGFIILGIAPIVVVFVLAQRHFTQGISHTGLKG
jgi:ABC-type glycerol-3-phosphate transport system permease component